MAARKCEMRMAKYLFTYLPLSFFLAEWVWEWLISGLVAALGLAEKSLIVAMPNFRRVVKVP